MKFTLAELAQLSFGVKFPKNLEYSSATENRLMMGSESVGSVNGIRDVCLGMLLVNSRASPTCVHEVSPD